MNTIHTQQKAPASMCDNKCDTPKLDPRVVRTRRDLVESMRTLMRERTFSRITVQAITEQALINRATFYAHFEDKFHLLQFMIQEAFEKKVIPRVHFCDGVSQGNLQILSLATCEFLAEFHDQYAPSHINDYPPIERLIQPLILEILKVWVKISGEEADEQLSADTKAITLSWAIFGSALQWSRGQRVISAETLTDQIMTLIIPGLEPTLV